MGEDRDGFFSVRFSSIVEDLELIYVTCDDIFCLFCVSTLRILDLTSIIY